jgi:hypothetical protein
MRIGQYLRHLTGCGIFTGQACDCGMLRAEGALEDLLNATDEIVSAVQDGLRRYRAGDPLAIASNLISATLKQAEEAIKKSR